MATSATGGGGGQSAYNNQVVTFVGENEIYAMTRQF